MEERLRQIAASVSDWVKFAESKNAAIVAFDGATVFGIVNFLKGQHSNLGGAVRVGAYCTLALLLLSLLLSLLSFMPNVKIPFLSTRSPLKADDNLLYYGHIAKYDEHSYIESLCKKMAVEVQDLTAIERYYAQQIVESACIALRKYRIFSCSVAMTLLALVIALVSGMLFIIT